MNIDASIQSRMLAALASASDNFAGALDRMRRSEDMEYEEVEVQGVQGKILVESELSDVTVVVDIADHELRIMESDDEMEAGVVLAYSGKDGSIVDRMEQAVGKKLGSLVDLPTPLAAFSDRTISYIEASYDDDDRCHDAGLTISDFPVPVMA